MPERESHLQPLASGPFCAPASGLYRPVLKDDGWSMQPCTRGEPGARTLGRGEVVHGVYVAAVHLETTAPDLGRTVLALPLGEGNIAGAATFRGYLAALARAAAAHKRPLGFSGWRYDLYEPLARAGLLPCRFAADGEIDWSSIDRVAADELIAAALIALGEPQDAQ